MTTVGECRVQPVEHVGQERRTVTIPPRRGQVKKMMFEAIAQAFVSACDDSCLGAGEHVGQERRTVTIPPRRGQVKKMMFEVIAQAFVSVCDDSCLGAVQVMPDSPPPPPPPPHSFTNYSTTTC